METLFVYILPEHVCSKIDETEIKSYKNEGPWAATHVGADPYLVAERKIGEFTRHVSNPNFYRGRPPSTRSSSSSTPIPTRSGQALKKGEIDYADSLEANVYDSLEDAPGIDRRRRSTPAFNELAFNTGAALVRRHADRRRQPAAQGQAPAPGARLVPRPTDDRRQGLRWGRHRRDHHHPADVRDLAPDPPNAFSYDPEKAKHLLDDAGYKLGSDGIRRAENGTRLDFRLFARSDSPTSQKSVEFVKGYFAAVGIETEVSLISEDALTEIIGQGDFDMFEWGWVVEPDPNYQLSTFTCDNRSYEDGDTVLPDLSDSFHCNPKYDELFAAQATETDPPSASRDRQADAAAPLRRLALPGDVRRRQPDRLSLRPVRGFPPAARSPVHTCSSTGPGPTRTSSPSQQDVGSRAVRHPR